MDWLRLSLVIPQGFKPKTFRTGNKRWNLPKRLYLSAFQGFSLFTLRLFCGYHRRELGSFAYFSL